MMVARNWNTEGCSTYNGRSYWVVWTSHPGVYGGRRYLMGKTDRKRFYDESKAEAAAAKLNRAAQLDGGQGEEGKA